MNLKIFLILIIPVFNISSQWTNVGFNNSAVTVIEVWKGNVIVPKIGEDRNTYFYASSDYGGSWDSVGFVPAPWIEDIQVTNDYLFSSCSWGCTDLCPPLPCVFRTDKNWLKTDTLYIKDGGVSSILFYRTKLFVDAGNTYIFSTDFGESWQTLTSIPASNGLLHAIDSSIFLITQTKPIFISNNEGISWELFNNNLPSYSNCVIKVNGDLLFGGAYGIACFSSNNEWRLCNIGIPNGLKIEIIKSMNNLVFASGYDSTLNYMINCSTDYGESWFSISKGLGIEPKGWINSMIIQDNYLFVAADGIWRYDFSSLVDFEEIPTLVADFNLYQNYPNPFNPSTKISWQSPVSGRQVIKVFDVLGNEVATLVDEYKPAGSYEVEFQSAIGNRQLASGVYYYQLKAGDFVETKKMMLLR